MVNRDVEPRLKMLAKQFPAIVMTGPRQSGKSTLCQKVFPNLPYTTLESPDVRRLPWKTHVVSSSNFRKGQFWMRFKTARRLPPICRK